MDLKTKFQYMSYAALLLAFTSCGSSDTDTDSAGSADTASVNTQETNAKAQKVFSAIPSPVEATSVLKAAGAKYNPKYLNPIENVSKYSSIKDQALNLGVYGSDLSFTSTFDQTQESMLYMKCTNALASKLGISGSFDEKMSSRAEANMDNRDSLLAIISGSYWSADAYLKANAQPGVSALMVAGGWIEGLYIATQIAGTSKNEVLASRIGEQKGSLDNLISLLDSYKTGNGIPDVLTSLNSLRKIYESLPTSPKADSTKAATGKKEEVVVKLTDEQLKQISDKTAEIRNKMIQGS